MKQARTIRPPADGTKKIEKIYGANLFKVRYYKTEDNKNIHTIELIVDTKRFTKKYIKKENELIKQFISRIVEDVRDNDLSDTNLINKYSREMRLLFLIG
jgi:hypothetical protein